MMGPFKTVCADPPWPFKDKLPGKGRGAVKHYKPMPIAQIRSFLRDHPEIVLAPDVRLLLWRVASMQVEALMVMMDWGFIPKAEMVWVKQWPIATSRYMGMGRQVRNEHETAIIGTSGRPERLSKSVRSTFTAPTGRHSEKPELFYDLVEEFSPGPYCELFARRERPGWTCFGDELEST